MSFKEWKEWYKSLPKSMRWFVWLVLFRPIVDNFYYLKEVSPFLSPLNIIGILTPFIIFYSIRNMRRPPQSEIDTNVRIWGGFIVTGIVVMGLTGFFLLPFWTVAFKVSLPLYLLIFLRYFVRSRRDVDGVLQTFLYGSIVVISIFMFEIFIHPLNMVHSRGLERYQGSFADVFDYAIYVTLCTLINYYFLLRTDSTLSRATRVRNVVLNIVIASAMLFKMSHVASDIVFLALNVLYFLVAFKKNAIGALIFGTVIVLIIYAYGQETIDKNLMPLIDTDVKVAQGDEDESAYFHGRVGRWERIGGIFNESSYMSQLFGMPFTGELPLSFVTGGVHNDYLRNLILMGYVGLLSYLLLLFNLFRRIIKHQLSMFYLGMGALGSLILYSMTTVPTIYPSYLYIIMTIFAYFSIPSNVLKLQEKLNAKK